VFCLKDVVFGILPVVPPRFNSPHCNFAYSALASFRMGMSGSASFQMRSRFPGSAGLHLPSLNVHAHHEKPEEYRYVPEEAADQIVGGQIGYEPV
jgi:hypothetical protein